MFGAKNTAGELERRRSLSAVTNNLAALLGLLVLGFPITPSTIRMTLAGWALVTVAALQFVLRCRRIGPEVCRVPMRTIREG